VDEAGIWRKLVETFREVFDDESLEIGPETTAGDVDEWDSLIHIQLLVAIERAFDMRFNTGEVAGLANVGEMVSLIQSKSS
jgi:acyl carrier protein